MSIEIKNKMNEEEKKEWNETKTKFKTNRTKLLVSLITAIACTVLIFVRGRLEPIVHMSQLESWGRAGVYGAVFLLCFAITIFIQYYSVIKDKWKINKNIWLLIVSVICGAFVTYAATPDKASISSILTTFALASGITYILFTIFDRTDFKRIQHMFVEFLWSLTYCVIIPSMFLILVVMGKIDKQGIFLQKASEQMDKASSIFSNGAFKLVTVLYNLGKYSWSMIFVAAIFACMLAIATVRFYRKGWRIQDAVQPDPEAVKEQEIKDLKEEVRELKDKIEKLKETKDEE